MRGGGDEDLLERGVLLGGDGVHVIWKEDLGRLDGEVRDVGGHVTLHTRSTSAVSAGGGLASHLVAVVVDTKRCRSYS